MVLSEDECILNGWNTHFQRLSTPDTGIENTEDPSAVECTLIEEILKDPKKRKEISDITTTTTEEAIQKLAKGKASDHMGLTAEYLKKRTPDNRQLHCSPVKCSKKGLQHSRSTENWFTYTCPKERKGSQNSR
jgi:hypothetical protein